MWLIKGILSREEEEESLASIGFFFFLQIEFPSESYKLIPRDNNIRPFEFIGSYVLISGWEIFSGLIHKAVRIDGLSAGVKRFRRQRIKKDDDDDIEEKKKREKKKKRKERDERWKGVRDAGNVVKFSSLGVHRGERWKIFYIANYYRCFNRIRPPRFFNRAAGCWVYFVRKSEWNWWGTGDGGGEDGGEKLLRLHEISYFPAVQ